MSIQQHYAPTLRFRPPGTLTLTAAPTATDFTGIHRFTDIIPGNYQSGATFPAPTGIATYLARYELICYLVTPQGYPLGSGSVSVSFVSGPPPYAYNCFTGGSILTLTARPNPGYEFEGWVGIEPASSANPLT